jgi:hypothetical protein
MMQHKISSANTHQDQRPCRLPVPLTPRPSWSRLSECPAPPERCAVDFFGMECSSTICMPMLTSSLSPRSEWEESPILRPRPSFLSIEHTQDHSVISTQMVSSSYPHHFPSEGSSCPSGAALDDESCSLSDESTDESSAGYPFASEVSFDRISLKDSTLWACPLPSMINGDSSSVRLHPRSLPLRPDIAARVNSSPPLMPMAF